MAVNKNFVVKNGLEVNSDLIVADSTTKNVGIGSTIPSYTLEVVGGIGVTNIYSAGITTIKDKLRVGTGGTVLSVLEQGGFVGVGTTNPVYALDVLTSTGATTGTTVLYVLGDAEVTGNLDVGGDIVYDEVTGRNLNITGVSTFAYVDINDGDIVVDSLDVTGVTTGARFLAIDVSVSGVATITVARLAGIATINANGSQITGLSTFDGNVHLPDNKTLYFGGTPGTTTGDLQLFHDASHSYIRDQGTGDIRVRASGFDVRDSANALSILRADASGFMATTGINTVGVASITDVVVSGASTFNGQVTFNYGSITFANVHATTQK